MHQPPEAPAAAPAEPQDVVNMLLAAAVQATAALRDSHHIVQLTVSEPQISADLADTAGALTRIRDALLRTADELSTLVESDPHPR